MSYPQLSLSLSRSACQGLQLMKVGGKARLTIPASLGYGAKQMNSIPPNSELNFEVELLGAKSESMLPDNYLGRSFGTHSTLEAPPSREHRGSPRPCLLEGARLAPGGAPRSGRAAQGPRRGRGSGGRLGERCGCRGAPPQPVPRQAPRLRSRMPRVITVICIYARRGLHKQGRGQYVRPQVESAVLAVPQRGSAWPTGAGAPGPGCATHSGRAAAPPR